MKIGKIDTKQNKIYNFPLFVEQPALLLFVVIFVHIIIFEYFNEASVQIFAYMVIVLSVLTRIS